MKKFEMNKNLYEGFSLRNRRILVANGFTPKDFEWLIWSVPACYKASDYNLGDLKVGECYSILKLKNLKSIQDLCVIYGRKTGKKITVNEKLGITARLA